MHLTAPEDENKKEYFETTLWLKLAIKAKFAIYE